MNQAVDPYEYEERMAILEYDANIPKEKAEAMALEMMEAAMKRERVEKVETVEQVTFKL